MTGNAFTLRPIHADDGRKLSDLHESVWGNRFNDGYWAWKYLAPPFKTATNVVEGPDGKIVAFTGAWMRPIRAKGNLYESCQLVDALAHPEYRGGVAYGYIMDVMKDLLFNQKVFLFGFVNNASYTVYKKYFEKQMFIDENTPVSSLILRPGKLIRAPEAVRAAAGCVTETVVKARIRLFSSKEISVTKAHELPGDIELLWEKIKDDYPYRLVQDMDYLRWRFQDSPDHYQFWIARQNNQLAGVLVTTLVKRADKVKGYLVDWMFPLEEVDVFKALLTQALHWFLQGKTNVVEAWPANQNDPAVGVLKSFFFIKGRRSKRLIAGCTEPAMYQMENLSARDLLISRGDSDFSTLISN
nr:hypothetical protein [uncultured Desulfobacter sp.]